MAFILVVRPILSKCPFNRITGSNLKQTRAGIAQATIDSINPIVAQTLFVLNPINRYDKGRCIGLPNHLKQQWG